MPAAQLGTGSTAWTPIFDGRSPGTSSPRLFLCLVLFLNAAIPFPPISLGARDQPDPNNVTRVRNPASLVIWPSPQKTIWPFWPLPSSRLAQSLTGVAENLVLAPASPRTRLSTFFENGCFPQTFCAAGLSSVFARCLFSAALLCNSGEPPQGCEQQDVAQRIPRANRAWSPPLDSQLLRYFRWWRSH